MKRIIAFILLAVLLLGFLAPLARAEETTETTAPKEETLGGWFGDGFRWELEDGTLTISGEGPAPDEAPWREHKDDIETLFIEDGVVTVAGGTFADCTNLKEIQFGRNMKEIGDYAFQGCTALEEIRMPESFRKFGVSCFGGCTNLTQVYCNGYMPRFSEGCLWNGARMYVYYAPDKVWGLEDVKTLERNFGGRLEVLCQDGTDPIPNDEEDPEPPEPVVKETRPAETEAPTEPTTVPTEAPTVPTTAATEPPVVTVPETTVPETTLPAATAAPTEAPTEATEPIIEEDDVRGGVIGLALIMGVLTFFIVGALVFKARSRKGKY